MAKVKMVLDIDFDELQKTKMSILKLALGLNEGEREPLSIVMNILDSIQDQAVDNPQNNFTQKQVFGV